MIKADSLKKGAALICYERMLCEIHSLIQSTDIFMAHVQAPGDWATEDAVGNIYRYHRGVGVEHLRQSARAPEKIKNITPKGMGCRAYTSLLCAR